MFVVVSEIIYVIIAINLTSFITYFINFYFLFLTADKNNYIKEIERNLDEVHDLVSKKLSYNV